jgi:ABC-type Na+ efflux pump permease subunit
MFWVFVGPLIFTTFFGVLMKAQPPPAVRLAIVNLDADDTLASHVTSALKRDGIIVTRANAVVRGTTALVIPAGAAAAIAADKAVDLTLHTGTEETRAENDLQFKVAKAMVASALGVTGKEPAGPLVVKPADLGLTPRVATAGFQRSVPSYMVMFVFLNLLVSGSGIAEERRLGLLRRLGMAPVTRREIVLGKLLSRFAVGWVQIAWMLLAGRLFFHIQWAQHVWVFVGFLTLFALACASLGILFGTFFSDPDKCRGIAVWTAILLSPLGGLWWPIEVVGPTMRRVSHLVPTGWAMEPINAMLAFGAGAREVAPFALAFVALFAVTFVLASRRLQTT